MGAATSTANRRGRDQTNDAIAVACLCCSCCIVVALIIILLATSHGFLNGSGGTGTTSTTPFCPDFQPGSVATFSPGLTEFSSTSCTTTTVVGGSCALANAGRSAVPCSATAFPPNTFFGNEQAQIAVAGCIAACDATSHCVCPVPAAEIGDICTRSFGLVGAPANERVTFNFICVTGAGSQ